MSLTLMTHFPVTRAQFYTPQREDDLGTVEELDVTSFGVDNRVNDNRVTLAACRHQPEDGYGFEFDLEPSAARALGERLIAAADDLVRQWKGGAE